MGGKDFEEAKHPRDKNGEFASGGGGGGLEDWAHEVLQRFGKIDPADKSEVMPNKEWVAPPPMGGKKAPSKGYSSDPAFGTNTHMGQVAEDAFVRLMGGHEMHPPGKVQSPLDVHFDGYAFEVKGQAAMGTDLKATPKKVEIEDKYRAAKVIGLKPAIALVVLDSRTKQAHAYYRDGLEGGRLSKNTGWKYLGSTSLRDEEILKVKDVESGRASKAALGRGSKK